MISFTAKNRFDIVKKSKLISKGKLDRLEIVDSLIVFIYLNILLEFFLLLDFNRVFVNIKERPNKLCNHYLSIDVASHYGKNSK